MIFSLGWLSDYTKIDASPEELGEMLTMAGFELEVFEDKAKDLAEVLVVRINSIDDHPNADRLSICEVTDGERNYRVVCGAPNISQGDRVPFARAETCLPPSTVFPQGVEIKETEIRGESSEGMLCSASEMGLLGHEEGILILPQNAELGRSMAEELGYDGIIFEIGITPNRPDCMSVFGIAREVSGILGQRLESPVFSLQEQGDDIFSKAEVRVLDSEACPRYCCRLVEGVRIGPSPAWLRQRLEDSGVRSVNNVVDITNFVMLEQGQPLHAFDYDKLNNGLISVRKARNGEEIETLDGATKKLCVDDLLICSGDAPVALAGVMGGEKTAISDETVNILIESACFSPLGIRKTSKRTGIKSESSNRFEKGVDINNVLFSLDRAADLVNRIAGGSVATGAIDVYPEPVIRKQISLSVNKVRNLVGVSIDAREIVDLLLSLEFSLVSFSEESLEFKIPTFRMDIEREVDIIEEVARLWGYDNIPSVSPEVPMVTKKPSVITAMEKRLRDIFVSYGFLESINYSFESPDLLRTFGFEESIRVMNPISQELSEMRRSPLPSLVKNIRLNLSRQNQDVRLFESAKVFYPRSADQLPNEIKKFAAVATGKREPGVWGGEKFDFFDIKNVFQRSAEVLSIESMVDFEPFSPDNGFLWPGKSCSVTIGEKSLGFVGELHPYLLEKLEINENVYVLELDLSLLSSIYTGFQKTFVPLPKYPSLKRDIAIVVDVDVTVREILSLIKSDDSGIIEDYWVFDVYQEDSVGKGKKSVALSLVLRDKGKTLTDDDANRVQQRILRELEKNIEAELRS